MDSGCGSLSHTAGRQGSPRRRAGGHRSAGARVARVRDPRLEEGEEEPLRSAVQQARALTAAVTETRAIFRLADEAYAPYSCPASGECCRLAVTGRRKKRRIICIV